MTKRTSSAFQFPRCQSRRVEASFDGGEITSDAGVLLLRAAARRTGMFKRLSCLITDPRRRASCRHTLRSIIEQRVYAIALGYEDLNDHDILRTDTALQTGVGRDEALAHSSTLCRFENKATKEWAWKAHQVLFELFIAAHDSPPNEVVLDFDNTDDRVHGEQVGRHFHNYYGGYCFLPLYVFCGQHLLVAHLQPSSDDGAKRSAGILALLVRAIRQKWPQTNIVFRGDGGFSRIKIMHWAERNGVGYIIGQPQNKRLLALVKDDMDALAVKFKEENEKQRVFKDLRYAARSWRYERRVIARLEHLQGGPNPRFIVTNLGGHPEALYTEYCGRGEMENRIKEQQLDLLADRTSCRNWWPNQWRLLLAGLAYTLMAFIRRVGLAGTKLSKATCGTLRIRLLKIGAVVLRNTRRVRLLMSSVFPHKELFLDVAARLTG